MQVNKLGLDRHNLVSHTVWKWRVGETGPVHGDPLFTFVRCSFKFIWPLCEIL